jgi:integrase
MVNVNFNLRKSTSKQAEIIYLVLRWEGNYWRYTTRFKVLPKNWDNQKQRVRAVITEPLRDSINKHLAELENAAKAIYSKGISENQHISQAFFKDQLDKWTGRKVVEKPNFWNFVNDYVESSKTRLDVKTGRTLSVRTIQEFNTTIKALKELEKENRYIIDFDNANIDTLIDFRDFLTTVKGYAVNNVAKHIDNLRQFFRAAASNKIAFDTDIIDIKKFRNARENAHHVYLSEGELINIYNLQLDLNTRLDRARDLFLIGCYTGLRISDYNNIKPHNIKGGYMHIFQSKTGGHVVIPIHTTVKKILDKYNGNTPPKLSDQELNKYIKEVALLAKINEPTEKQQTKAGVKKVEILKKWELISSHTARRSFATNMTKQGLPIQTIMKITGHSKEATFLKYVKLSAMEHAEIVAKHWQEKQ